MVLECKRRACLKVAPSHCHASVDSRVKVNIWALVRTILNTQTSKCCAVIQAHKNCAEIGEEGCDLSFFGKLKLVSSVLTEITTPT